jgi:hypothetical protein
MADFDVKRVSTLEWAGIGAGLAAFIFSFFSWASVDVEDGGMLALVGIDTTASAWGSGFLAWFSVLLLIAAGALVALPHFGIEVPRLAMNWLVLSGVATLFILIRAISYETLVSPAFGLFLGLIAAIVSGVAALMVFLAEQKKSAAGPAPAA